MYAAVSYYGYVNIIKPDNSAKTVAELTAEINAYFDTFSAVEDNTFTGILLAGGRKVRGPTRVVLLLQYSISGMQLFPVNPFLSGKSNDCCERCGVVDRWGLDTSTGTWSVLTFWYLCLQSTYFCS